MSVQQMAERVKHKTASRSEGCFVVEKRLHPQKESYRCAERKDACQDAEQAAAE